MSSKKKERMKLKLGFVKISGPVYTVLPIVMLLLLLFIFILFQVLLFADVSYLPEMTLMYLLFPK